MITVSQKQILLLRSFVIIVALFSFVSASAQSGPSNLNVSGVLYSSTGDVINNPSVNFKLEVWDKAATCILYSEEHLSENLSTSKGNFSLALGKGSSINNYLESSSVMTAKVFENSGAVAGGWTGCASGTTLSSGDERLIRLYYDLGGGYVAMNPDVPLASSAYAMVAQTLQGKAASDFVQLRDDASYDLNQANVENVFSSTNYARLLQLLNPSAALGFGSQRLTNLADPTSAQDASTKNYSDSNLAGKNIDLSDVGSGTGGGKVLMWDQSQNKWVASAPSFGGPAGGDLTGTYPNPTVAALAIGTSKLADSAVTSAKINSTGISTNRLLITDGITGSTVTYKACANDEVLKFVTGTGWACATVASLAPVTSVNGKTGAVTLNAADLSLGTAALKDYGTAAGNLVELDAGAKIPTALLPNLAGDVTGAPATNVVTAIQGRAVASTAPNDNEVLKWNQAQTRWEPAAISSYAITALTGDVTASGTGSVTATIGNGKVTTAKLFTNPGVNRLVATDSSTGATLSAFSCSLNQIMQWGASGWTCQDVSSVMAGAGDFKADGSVPMTGNLRLNGNFLSGDGGSEGVFVDSSGKVGVGTTSPASALHVDNGTITSGRYGNSGAIVLRSASGSSSAPTALANGSNGGIVVFRGYDGSTYLDMASIYSSVTDSGTITPSSAGSNLVFTTTTSGGTTVSEKMRITNLGNIGIGTSTPARLLHVAGPVRITPATLPSSPAAGDLAFDSGAANALKFYDGSSWQTVGTGSGSGDFKADGSVPMTGNLRLNGNFLSGDGGSEGIYVDSSGNVGVGTTSPIHKIHVAGYGSTGQSLLTLENSSPSSARPLIHFRKSRGTLSAPTDVIADDYIGEMIYQAYIDGDYRSTASVRADAEGTPSSTSYASRLVFFTTSSGQTARAERMRIDNAGNVGIGTTTPARLLHVAGPMRITPATLPSSPAAGDLAFDSGAANALKFYDGSSWQTVGTGSGSGDFKADGSVPMTGNLRLNGNFLSGDGGSEGIYVDSSGKVGVGTSTPGALLQAGSISTATIDPSLSGSNLGHFSLAASQSLMSFGLGATSPYPVWIQGHNQSGQSVKLALNPSGGFVGIGTTSPNSHLTVAGPTGNVNLQIMGLGPNQNAILNLTGTDGAGAASTAQIWTDNLGGLKFQPSVNENKYYFNDSSGSTSMFIYYGNVGIGTTTPSYKLDVAGTIRSSSGGIMFPDGTTQTTAAGGGGSGQWGYASPNLYYTAGNVGIGTTNPGAKLHINGGNQYIQDPSNSVVQGLYFTPSDSSLRNYVQGYQTSTPSSDYLQIGSYFGAIQIVTGNPASSPTPRLTILNGGNVGIGTTSPLRPMHLANSGVATMIIESTTAGADMKKRYIASGSGALGFGKFTDDMTTATEQMRIDANGNVGIGTTSPGTLLDIQGGGGAQLSIGPGSGTNNATMQMIARNGGVAKTVLLIANQTGDYVIQPILNVGISTSANNPHGGSTLNVDGTLSVGSGYYTSAAPTNGMIVQGNLGIGTTAPSYKLDVAGTIRSSSGGIMFPDGTTQTTAAGGGGSGQWGYASPNLYYTAGNVGIGTTSPTRLLQVDDGTGTWPQILSNRTNSQFNGIGISNSGNRTMWMRYDFTNSIGMVATEVSSPLALGTGSNERMRIDASGNVGIGTTSPSNKLTIVDADTSPALSLTNSSSTTARYPQIYVQNYSGGNGGAPIFGLFSSRGSAASPSALQSGDSIGLIIGYGNDGTTTLESSRIALAADENFGSSARGGRIAFSTVTAGTTTETERMRITSSGNIGIGTTSPSYKLDVAGTIRSSTGGIMFPDGTTQTTAAGGGGSGQWGYASPNLYYTAGNVGIGTTNPTNLLHIKVDQNATTSTSIENKTAGTGANSVLNLTSDTASANLGIFSSSYSTIYPWQRQNGLSLYTSSTSAGGVSIAARSASGIVTIHTGGDTERLRVDANGNVGIGTTSPATRLTVGAGTGSEAITVNAGTGWADLRLTSGPNNGGKIYWNNGTADIGNIFYYHGSGGNYMSFTTNSNERFRIDSAGNVGIGTTSPSYKLDVAGTIRSSTGGIVFPDGTTQTTAAGGGGAGQWGYSNPNVYYTGGNVGIGTSSPASLLHIQQNAASSRSLLTIDNTNTGVSSTAQINMITPDSGLVIYASPAASTESFGGVSGTTAAVMRSSSSYPVSKMIVGTSSAAPLYLMRNNAIKMTVDSSVGIGTTTPQAPLHIYSGTSGQTFSNQSGLLIENAGTSNLYYSLQVATGAGSVFNVMNSGNVGIGTTSPSYPLQVIGNIKSQNTTLVADQTGITIGSNGASMPKIDFNVSDNSKRFWLQVNGINTATERLSLYGGPINSTATTEMMSFNGSGNVGIGTTSPSYKLDVAGTIRSSTGGIMFPDGTTQTTAAGGGGAGQWTFSNPNIYYTAGNVGIGSTAPSVKLHVNAGVAESLRLQGTGTYLSFYDTAGSTRNAFIQANSQDLLLGADGASSIVRFKTNNVERARIDQNGNLGIGITSPNYPLHVQSSTAIAAGYGSAAAFTNNPTNAVTPARTNALQLFAYSNDTANPTGYVAGIDSRAVANNTSTTVPELIGVFANAYLNASGGSATNIYGVKSQAAAYSGLTSGSIGTAVSIYAQAPSVNGSTVTMTNAYSLLVDSPNAATNNFAIYQNGTAKSYLGGNVGIGTTSPSYKLDVAGTIRSSSGGIMFPDGTTQTTAAGGGGAGQWGYSNPNVYYNTGNVGIGTTAPNDALHVIGNIRSQAGSVVAGDGSTWKASLGTLTSDGLIQARNSSSVTNVYLTSNGSSYLTGGNVGIGTTTPLGALDIANSNKTLVLGSDTGGATRTDATQKLATVSVVPYTNSNNPWAVLYAGSNASSNSLTFGGGNSGLTAATVITFNTASAVNTATGTERMRIDSTGYVGIGTTSPAVPLDIKSAGGQLYLRATNTKTALSSFDAGSGNDAMFDISPLPGNGTSDAAVRLFRTTSTTGARYFQIFKGDGTNIPDTNIAVASSTYFNISGGNVGIGTSTPAYKLDVAGTIRSSSGGIMFPDGTTQTTAAGGGGAGQWGYSNPNVYYNAGSVGVGTSTPNRKIEIYQTDSNNAQLRLTSVPSVAGTSYESALEFYTAATSGAAGLLSGRITSNFLGASYTNTVLKLQNATTGGVLVDTMTLNNGKVGIGTTSPSALLDVKGMVSIAPSGTTNDNGYNGGVAITKPAASGQYINLIRALTTPWSIGMVYNTSDFAIGGGQTTDSNFTNPYFVIRSTGAVGIGTTSPGVKLEVSDSVNVGMRVRTTGGTPSDLTFSSQTSGMSFIGSMLTNTPVGFITGNTERMRIETTGNVGIGITIPTRLLHVAGPIRITPAALPSSPAAGDLAFDSGASNALKFYDGSSWQTVSTGGGGGGSSPWSSITYTSDIGYSTGAVQIGTTAATYDTFKLRVTGDSWTSGKVLVGGSTANYPGYELEVAGDIISSGNTEALGCVKANYSTLGGVCSSDQRLKTDLHSLGSVAAKMATLKPTYYHWRKDEFPDRHFHDREELGLIAQDVRQVMPELVTEDKDGYMKVNYSPLLMYVIKSFGELYKQVQELMGSKADQQEFASLKARTDQLERENERLKEGNIQLEKENAEIKSRLERIEKAINENSFGVSK